MTAYWIIFSFIGVGFALARIPWMPPRASYGLNQVAIFICLPALILIHVPHLEPSWGLAPLIIVPWSIWAMTILCIWPLAHRMGWSREVTAVLLVLLPLGNTSFLGFPLVDALFGPDYLPLAVVYDQFGSFLMVCTHVLWVVAWFGSGDRPSVGQVFMRMIKFPPFIALVIALWFGHDWLGVWGMAVAELLAAGLLPIVTLAIGLALRWSLPHEQRLPLVFGVMAKLLLIPAGVVGLLLAMEQLTELNVAVARVALLESAMPAMITASALLYQARLAPELANAMVAWTVLLSVATVPIWFQVGQWIWGVI